MDIPTYLSHPVQLATVTYSDPPVTKLHRALASPAPKQDKKTPAKTRWPHLLLYLIYIYSTYLQYLDGRCSVSRSGS